MSREIKFRAYLWSDRHTNDQWVRWEDGIKMFWQEYLAWQAHKELMQFTGLRDRKGVEIYEGDILRLNHAMDLDAYPNWLGVAEYRLNEYHSQFWVRSLDKKHINDDAFYTCEVIGNIYEHPDLLAQSGK